MGKYGIGARVRDFDGDLAEVIGKPSKGTREIRIMEGGFEGRRYTRDKSELTPVAISSAEKGEVAFAVGDRVVAAGGPAEDRVGTVAFVDSDDGTIDVKFDDWAAGHDGQAGDGSSSHWWFFAEELRPFTIEAGRYYRTRDGRKVGPMVPTRSVWTDRGGDTSAFDDADGTYYTASGLYLTRYGKDRPEDIVAIWTEPEAPAAKLTIEAGKFYRTKAGRRVGPMYDTQIGDGFPWRNDGDLVDFYSIAGVAQFDDDHLVAEWVEPEPAAAPEKPKFKVGDRVDLIRDGEPVEQWSNMTITEIDRGEFVFPIKTDVGLPCFENELRLSPAIPVDSAVSVTGKLVAVDEQGEAEVHFDSLGYTLYFPASALSLAA